MSLGVTPGLYNNKTTYYHRDFTVCSHVPEFQWIQIFQGRATMVTTSSIRQNNRTMMVILHKRDSLLAWRSKYKYSVRWYYSVWPLCSLCGPAIGTFLPRLVKVNFKLYPRYEFCFSLRLNLASPKWMTSSHLSDRKCICVFVIMYKPFSHKWIKYSYTFLGALHWWYIEINSKNPNVSHIKNK